ncbi:MAG: prolipoprotein diacylglyceryl transferase [Phycisphaerales bacterium]|nr:prolipoprotein diacylglyceryl transferase [Phycisphaerales bacterium]
MHPELFRIFNFPIYSYGLMLVIGFLLATELAKCLARRVGTNPEIYVNAGLIALVAGVIGARLSHVLENFSQYALPQLSLWQNLGNAARLTDGGLTFYGGFLLATPVVMLYGWRKKVNILRGMDVVAPALMVGLAIGRIGCFLNGCCYGEISYAADIPTVSYPYGSNAYVDHFYENRLPAAPAIELTNPADPRGLLPRHYVESVPSLASIARNYRSAPTIPTQLYSTFTALLIAGVCVSYFSLSPIPGRVFGLMLMLEGPTRFILEMLRVEPAVIGHGTDSLTFLPAMSISMILGAIIFMAGVFMWLGLGLFGPRPASPTSIVAAGN